MNALRGLRGYFLDLDAAVRRRHDERQPDGVVDHDPQVKLTVDLQLLLDEYTLHESALGPRLVCHQPPS